MPQLLDCLAHASLAPALVLPDADELAHTLGGLSHLDVYARSITAAHHALFFFGQRDATKWLGCLTQDRALAAKFTAERNTVRVADDTELTLLLAPTSAANAAALRSLLPFLQAQTLGLRQSAGCGDRLGLATPGHIHAFRSTFGDEGQGMAPILTQQSIRENARTGRTPQAVMDDAMWGVFQEGWRHGFGADADHLKNTDDIDVCAAAGYTFYTVDPGAYVDDEANTAPLSVLQAKVGALPWAVLQSSPQDLQARLADQPINLGDFSLTFSVEELLRAAAKYGKAVAHTVTMHAHLAAVMGTRPFELEMSVDETETVTSLAEHVYIAAELQRLGVRCVSLAPRYPGRFEKGADYIGDLAEFEAAFAQHFAVAKTFGPYKLSLHSGSDKFSIYPIAARVAGELVHLKTAGTSYLEALRAIATLDPALFRTIVDFAIERYPTDRATYHVSAEIDKLPYVNTLADSELPALLDDFHAREILHVTFGSVLNHAPFRTPFFAALRNNEATYTAIVEKHFNRHFTPFVRR